MCQMLLLWIRFYIKDTQVGFACRVGGVWQCQQPLGARVVVVGGGGVISLNSSGIHNKAAAIFFACVFALSRSTWCISPPTGDGSKYNEIGECDISVYIVISPCKNCSTNCILFWMEFSSTIFLLQPMHFMRPTTSRSFQTSVLRTL